MNRRRGISLLELTAVLAGCSVIFSTSGSLRLKVSLMLGG